MIQDTDPVFSTCLVQLTDTHLFAERDRQLYGVPTFSALQSVAHDIGRRYPRAEVCLVTGDVAQDGAADSYGSLLEALAGLTMPIHALPGNHDHRDTMRRVLTAGGIGYCGALYPGEWQVVLLDTCVDGENHGYLAETELERLDGLLRQHRRHTLVALHHPPVPLGSPWIDGIGLRNGSELLTLLGRHRVVRAVLWGHAHQEYSEQRDGLWLWGSPATCIQFAPRSAEFVIDKALPGYRVVYLGPGGRIRSRVERIAAFPNRPDPQAEGY